MRFKLCSTKPKSVFQIWNIYLYGLTYYWTGKINNLIFPTGLWTTRPCSPLDLQDPDLQDLWCSLQGTWSLEWMFCKSVFLFPSSYIEEIQYVPAVSRLYQLLINERYGILEMVVHLLASFEYLAQCLWND